MRRRLASMAVVNLSFYFEAFATHDYHLGVAVMQHLYHPEKSRQRLN